MTLSARPVLEWEIGLNLTYAKLADTMRMALKKFFSVWISARAK